MREKERIAEASKQAPGAYTKDVVTFGKDLGPMTIFGKNKDKYESKPAVGQYRHEQGDGIVKPRTQSALIKKATNPYRRPQE